MIQTTNTQSLSSAIGINPESYLVFVYGKSRKDYAVFDFNNQQKQTVQNTQNLLNQSASSGVATGVVGKVGMALWTSPVAQNLASKALPNAVLNRVNSSLYDIMADGKVSLVETGEDLIGNFTNILDNMATDLGFPTPTGLYSAIMPGGTGVPSKDFANLFSQQTVQANQTIKQQENQQLDTNNEILKFKVVTKDSESWDTDIPTRKTEKGMFLAPVLGNHNLTKNYTIVVVNNPSKGTSMYQERDRLYKLRDERVKFDVYVYDYDVQEVRNFKNCVFSNITIDTEGKNALTLGVSITQIPEYEVRIDTNLDKSIKGISGASGKQNPSKNAKTKASPRVTKNVPKFPTYTENDTYNQLNKYKNIYLNNKQIYQNPKYSETQRKNAYKDLTTATERAVKLQNRVADTKGWHKMSNAEMQQAFNANHDFRAKGK